MTNELNTTTTQAPANGERGAAIIIALMVALVLAFLGLGLLLQTSLGLQAAGTDRWVVRALYAADAGTQAEIATLATGSVSAGNFVLADNAGIPGMLSGQYNVTVTDVCETAAMSDPIDPQTGVSWGVKYYKARHFFFRSQATRDAGILVGQTQATITQDVTIVPIPIDNCFPATTCY